ncbi:hypothetical protein Tco_1318841 [Tanacetum coccineum]
MLVVGERVTLCFNAFRFIYIDALCYDVQISVTPRVSALVGILPPRMTIQSAGRSTAAPRGGRTGGRTGRGGGRTREPTGHGSTHGSASVNDDKEDDSPVEEVSPVKPKKPSRRAIRAKKNDPRELPKEWTVEEEIALCQSWCDVSENNIVGNSMKTKGFWDAVITYLEKKTGSSRGYDSILSKWKNKVRPRIGAFCAIINNVEDNHEGGSNDLDVFQKACKEYKMIYRQDFHWIIVITF